MAKNCFIQYHNCGKLGRWPSIKKENGEKGDWGGIFTKKALPLEGNRVYLIAGVKQAGHAQNDYFLWEYIDVQSCRKDGNFLVYEGPRFPCKTPVLLNRIPEFAELKATSANFSTGLQDRGKLAISTFINDDSLYISLKEIEDPIEWQCEFEEKYITDEYWRDTMRDERGKAVEIPVEESST